MKRSGIFRLKDRLDDYKIFLDSYMTESLTAARNLEDCINKFYYYLYLIKNYSDYYLCLCDNWDDSADPYDVENPLHMKVGYTEEMKLVLACEDAKPVKSNYSFKTKYMIPDLWREREKPKAYYFTPLHFNDYCIGYSVITYGDMVEAYDITYRNWSRNIMNALEYYRMHKKLYLASFRDVLTGVYNRNGLKQNITNILDEAIREKKMLLIFIADLDNLKEINDNFGHMEGDNAITVVAKVIQSCLIGDEICARVGGDEFLVVGTYDETTVSPEEFIRKVNKYLRKYNKNSMKPYEVKISVGAFSDYITDKAKVNEMIDHADHIMYRNKARNKQKYNL